MSGEWERSGSRASPSLSNTHVVFCALRLLSIFASRLSMSMERVVLVERTHYVIVEVPSQADSDRSPDVL